VGYNVQTAVDTQHHLIVAHEVTNVGSDRRQLTNMGKQAKEAMGCDTLDVVADRGYYRSEEFLKCDEAHITAYVPNSATSHNAAKGLFARKDFHYLAADDAYECPAGERLIYRLTSEEVGKVIRRYWSSACVGCPLKTQCTTGTNRRVSRWEHETILEAAKLRLNNRPDMMTVRRTTVEHPFGTLKAWMGATHFLTKTLGRVSTEMSLHVLAYNFKRLVNIMGPIAIIEAISA
jgi:transposase